MGALPKILCVDDEPNVLHGLRRSLRGRFEVFTATGGEDALQLLQRPLDVAVICSDMRMPGMDGATFLGLAQDVAPDATRVLLSGQADLGSLVRVINSSGIYRFLVKPCERADLLSSLLDAAEQHRLRRAERELLEGTVAGSVRVLTEALSLVAPDAMGRSQKVQSLVARLARRDGVELDWEAATTASLACLGMIAVPPQVVAKARAGAPLDIDERAMLAAVPAVGAGLIEHVPRLAGVAASLRSLAAPARRDTWIVAALRAVLPFVEASERLGDDEEALTSLREVIEPKVLASLWSIVTGDLNPIVEVRRADLEVGMQLAEPLLTRTGVLLMPAGITIGEAAMEKLRNFALRYGIREPIRVRIQREDRLAS